MAKRILTVKHVQQSEPEWCWAACIKMVLNRAGQDPSQCAIVGKTTDLICCSGPMPMPEGCVRQSFDPDGIEHAFTKNDVAFGYILRNHHGMPGDQVMSAIDLELPIFAIWYTPIPAPPFQYAHSVLIYGYDTNRLGGFAVKLSNPFRDTPEWALLSEVNNGFAKAQLRDAWWVQYGYGK